MMTEKFTLAMSNKSLQRQPQTVHVKSMTHEEHMAVRETPFDRHLINFVFMQFYHSDYNDNRHFYPTCKKNNDSLHFDERMSNAYAELLHHSVLKGNI